MRVRVPVALDLALADIDWARALLGLAIFLAPGFAWAWALLGSKGWFTVVPAAVVLSFTLEPATLLALNFLFEVPLSVATGAYVSVLLAMLGLAASLRTHFARALPD